MISTLIQKPEFLPNRRRGADFDEKEVKPSFYNLIYPFLDNDSYILYNTMYGSIIVTNRAVKQCLETYSLSGMPRRVFERLVDLSFLIPIESDELAFYQVTFDKARYRLGATSIMLTLLHSCNLNCIYCVQGWGNSKERITKDTIHAIRTFIYNVIRKDKSDLLHIDFFGGEPLLSWNVLKEEIQHYKIVSDQLGIRYTTQIYTNGTIYSEEICRVLADHHLKSLQITLDGKREDHNQRRPFKGGYSSYDRILENVAKYCAYGIPVVVRVNFDKNNYTGVNDLLDDLESRDLKNKISICFFGVEGATEACRGFSDKVSDDEYVTIQEQLLDQAFNQGFNWSTVRPPAPRFTYCCASAESSYVVDFKRNVYKCACLQGYEENRIGELDHDGNLVNQEEEYFRWMSRNPLDFSQCRTCKLLPLCGGGCSGTAKGYFGTYNRHNCRGMSEERVNKSLLRYVKTKLRSTREG